MKSQAILRLRELAWSESRRKFPELPEYARTIHPYKANDANGLTRCIIDFLKMSGWQAERVAVTGRYIDTSRVVTNVLGQQKRIGSGKYIPSSMQKGSADMSATIKGRSIKIEVKYGNDVQSEAQKEYQMQVERAGGLYIIARDFDAFMLWYDSYTANH